MFFDQKLISGLSVLAVYHNSYVPRASRPSVLPFLLLEDIPLPSSPAFQLVSLYSSAVIHVVPPSQILSGSRGMWLIFRH